MEFFLMMFALIAGYMLGFSSGHHKGTIDAHLEVARECHKLGKFYVGKETFTCSKINEYVPQEEKQ